MIKFIAPCFFIIFLISVGSTQKIDPAKCRINGPGIENSGFHMPVRYFFVTLVGENGNKLNSSIGDAFIVIDNLDQSACSIWSKVIDRHDGSYVVRFKLFKKCSRLKLAVTTPEGRHLAQSPYTLQGPLYPESCYCPEPMDSWLSKLNCPKAIAQIDDDLASWPQRSINFTWMLEDAARRWATRPGAYSYCHYVIIDNEIWRKCYGQHVGFNMFSDAVLLSITRKVRLPNVQFLMNLGDWPLEKQADGPYVPMFSWCGSVDSKDIVVPTYDLTESTLEMMGRQSLDVFSAEGFAKTPWNEKLAKAFWRGRDSSEERLKLVGLSKQHPSEIDAGITRFFFFQDRMEEFGPEVPIVGFEHFFKYKYQISLDGTVAAYRLPYLLAGNGLVFKQESPYYEHFYHQLKPWIHFVPLKRDLSDLLEKIDWARQHDDEARNISRRAQLFVRKRLNPKAIFCYHARAFVEFAQRLSEPPATAPSAFEKVEQPKEARVCECEKMEAGQSQGQRCSENLLDVESSKLSPKHSTKDEL